MARKVATAKEVVKAKEAVKAPEAAKVKVEKSESIDAQLENWARAYKVSADPFVTGLALAIKNGKGVSAFAELNPLDYLPTPVHAGNERNTSLQNLLTIIRNFLVFFPVALTWIAVSKSTTAFAAYTEANKSAVVNFLEFWQNGYGILAKSWTIGHVAFLDFIIIIAVIALTLIVAFMHNRNVAATKAHVIKSEADRTAIGLKLHLYLHEHRAVTPTTISSAVARAVKDLADTAKSLEKSSKVLQKDINQIPSNRQVLTEVKRLVTGVKEANKVAKAASKFSFKKAAPARTTARIEEEVALPQVGYVEPVESEFNFDDYFKDFDKKISDK